MREGRTDDVASTLAATDSRRNRGLRNSERDEIRGFASPSVSTTTAAPSSTKGKPRKRLSSRYDRGFV